ncbi:MAG TPA: carbon-nitrogen hydrolase family protein [Bacillota bacterium]|nr:carbon-nitrogen hydrolase family protein [Bacillota bacterium]
MKLKVAMIQMEILGDPFNPFVKEKNLKKAEQLIRQAASEELDLIVLPDEFIAGYGYGPLNIPMPFEKRLYPSLCALAKELHLYIVGSGSDPCGFAVSHNAGFIIDNQGNLLGTQYRIQVGKVEAQYVKAGEELRVIETPLGRVGMLIGLDLLYPELARELVKKGAELLMAPVLTHSEIREENGISYDYPKNLYQIAAQARAMENGIFVVMTNGVGRHAFSDLPLPGGSLAVGPRGVIHQMGPDESIAYVTLGDHQADEGYIDLQGINRLRTGELVLG